jgi:hypothetical protein
MEIPWQRLENTMDKYKTQSPLFWVIVAQNKIEHAQSYLNRVIKFFSIFFGHFHMFPYVIDGQDGRWLYGYVHPIGIPQWVMTIPRGLDRYSHG